MEIQNDLNTFEAAVHVGNAYKTQVRDNILELWEVLKEPKLRGAQH